MRSLLIAKYLAFTLLLAQEDEQSDEEGEDVDSDEDSEYEKLIEADKEDHPIVKFTRMIQTKQAELVYHYDPVSVFPST